MPPTLDALRRVRAVDMPVLQFEADPNLARRLLTEQIHAARREDLTRRDNLMMLARLWGVRGSAAPKAPNYPCWRAMRARQMPPLPR